MTPETIGCLLHQSSKLKTLITGQSLHALALKSGTHSNTIVSNHILNMYAKCGHMTNARKVFDEMSQRNLVSWSALISGYDQVGEYFSGLELFSRLDIVPNEFVLASAIRSCAGLGDSILGQKVHARALKCGCGFVSFVSNALVSMYMECGLWWEGVHVHEEMPHPDVVSYNSLIFGFSDSQQHESAFGVFRIMQQQGVLPDRFTFAGVLGSCLNSGDLWRGALLHCLTIKYRLDSFAFVGNVVMTVYSKCGLIEEVEKAFRCIEDKDVISWNTYITACSHCDDHKRAFEAFREMTLGLGVKPDAFTFASVLTACAGIASLRHGKQVHTHLMRQMLHQDVGLSNALVNMYAKCGSIEYAYHTFSKMAHRSLVSWNTMIVGFGNHGLGKRAIEVFEEMKLMGVKPDSVTFVGLLTACNHAGLVDDGLSYFKAMEENYGISPVIEQFSCLIDLLGRAGRLREAEEYMKKYPLGCDPVVLGSFLSACRLHGDVVTGKRLAKELLELQPVTTSPFVLLSNLYASDDLWDGVAEARMMLKGSGIRKEPGHSLVEVKGSFQKFTVGGHSNYKIEEIKNMLATFNWDAGGKLRDI